MKLSHFSVHVNSYDETISGSLYFTGDPTSITHSLTRLQVDQLSALINQWKARILDEASAALIQARDDVLALEHRPTKTDPETNGVDDSDVPF